MGNLPRDTLNAAICIADSPPTADRGFVNQTVVPSFGNDHADNHAKV